MNCALIGPDGAPEKALSSHQNSTRSLKPQTYVGAVRRHFCQSLLVFVCCISCSFALNITEPPKPSLKALQMGGVAATSSLTLPLLPVHFRNTRLKTNMEVLKSKEHFLWKRSTSRSSSSLHVRKSSSTLCIRCRKSPRLFPSFANLSAPLTSLKTLNPGRGSPERLGWAVDTHRTQRLKKSPSDLTQVDILPPVKKQGWQRSVGNWVYEIFGGGGNLPLKSSPNDEAAKAAGFAESLDKVEEFDFDGWMQKLQGSLGSSIKNAKPFATPHQPALLVPTFQSVVPTRTFSINSPHRPDALNPELNASLSKVQERRVGSRITAKRPITLDSTNRTTVYRSSVGPPCKSSGPTGEMIQNKPDGTSNVVLLRRSEDIAGKLPTISQPFARVTTPLPTLIHSFMLSTKRLTHQYINPSVPETFSLVRTAKFLPTVGLTDTDSPFKLAILSDKLLHTGPKNQDSLAAALALKWSAYTAGSAATPSSRSLTTDAHFSPNICTCAPLQTQPSQVKLLPVKQVPRLMSRLMTSFYSSSLHTKALADTTYASHSNANRIGHRLDEGSIPVPELSTVLSMGVLGITDSVNSVFNGGNANVKGMVTAIVKNISTINISNAVQQQKHTTKFSSSPHGNLEPNTSPVTQLSSALGWAVTSKNKRSKRTLPKDFLSLRASESSYSMESASLLSHQTSISTGLVSLMSRSLDKAEPHPSSSATTYLSITRPDSVYLRSTDWIFNHHGKELVRLTKSNASTSMTTTAAYVKAPVEKASGVPYISIDQLTNKASSSNRLYGFITSPVKLERETVESSHSTPHVAETVNIMERPYTESSTMYSKSKGSQHSSFTEAQSSGLKDATLTTLNGPSPYGSRSFHNPALTNAYSNVHTSSPLPKATFMDFPMKTLSNSDTGSQGLLYFTGRHLASIEASTHENSDPKCSTQFSGTKAYGGDAITSRPFLVPTALDLKNKMNLITPTLGISSTWMSKHKSRASLENRIMSISWLNPVSSTASKALDVDLSTNGHTGSPSLPSELYLASRSTSEDPSPSDFQWSYPLTSTLITSLQTTAPSVATSPYRTVIRTHSDDFQMKATSKPMNMSSIYSSPKAKVFTSFQEATSHNSTVLTSQYNPITANGSLGSQLFDVNLKTVLQTESTVTAAQSSVTTVMVIPSGQGTLSPSNSHAPISTTPWFSQPHQTLMQSSQNKDIGSVSPKPISSLNIFFNANDTSTSHAGWKQSTKATLNPEVQTSTFPIPKAPQYTPMQVTSPAFSALSFRSSTIEVSFKTMATSEPSWTSEVEFVDNDLVLHDPGIDFLPWTTAPILHTPSNSTAVLLQPTPIFPTPSFATALLLQCRLIGIQYSADLHNKSSEAYSTLAKEVQLTMNKIFSATYGSSYFGTKIKGFLNGSVIVQAEISFQKSMSPPSSSDLVRTVVTEIYRNTHNYYAWKIEPADVQSNGKSMKNLDPEKLPLSFLALRMGSAASLMSPNSTLATLQNEVIQILSSIISLEEFVLVEVKNIRGDLSIKGDLYINTVTHTNARLILQALKNLANYSVDLSSLVVADVRLDLTIYPFSFRVINRALTVQLMDHSSAEFKQMALDLDVIFSNVLKNSVQPLQVVVRDLLSGSLLCRGDLIYQRQAPPSNEVLQVLVNSVGSSSILGSSHYQVDPISFTVADAKAYANYVKPVFPGYAVAIIVLCGLIIISIPLIVLLFLKTDMFGHKGKAVIQGRRGGDPEMGRTNLELGNRGYEPPVEQH